MGNGAGDDVGKFPLDDRESTSRVLADELENGLSDEYGNNFSPDFSGLMKW